MLTTDTIVRVSLNVRGASASSSAFDVGLILAQAAASVPEEQRLRTWHSAAEAAAGLIADGFPADSPAHRAALKYFAASPVPGTLLFSAFPASESPADALAAVLDRTDAFYGVFLAGEATEEQLLALEERIRSLSRPLMLFLPISGTVQEATSASGLLAQLNARQSRRTLPVYVGDAGNAADAAAVLGTAMGLERTHAGSAFSLCYKLIPAIRPQSLSQEQVDSLEALNANVYLTRGYSHLLFEKGTTASGARYDEVLYLDMIAEALRAASIDLLAESDRKLPQTDDTSAQFINRFSAILSRFYDREILATGPWRGDPVGSLTAGSVLEHGFALWADSYDLQSDADRAARRAMPIQVALLLSGSVESIVLSINVSV